MCRGGRGRDRRLCLIVRLPGVQLAMVTLGGEETLRVKKLNTVIQPMVCAAVMRWEMAVALQIESCWKGKKSSEVEMMTESEG